MTEIVSRILNVAAVGAVVGGIFGLVVGLVEGVRWLRSRRKLATTKPSDQIGSAASSIQVNRLHAVLKPSLLALVAAMFGFVIARVTLPATYSACILEKLSPAMTDLTAREIRRACHHTFDNKPPTLSLIQSVPPEVLSKLTSVPSAYMNNVGHIYNGDSKWTITQLVVTATNKNLKDEFDEPRLYRIEVLVPPLTSEAFSVSTDLSDSADVEWRIVGARGYRWALTLPQ